MFVFVIVLPTLPLCIGQARLISALTPLDFDNELSLHAGFHGRTWILEEIKEWMTSPDQEQVLGSGMV